MLDELQLQNQFRLRSCLDLFDPSCSILHTTSLIKYPCFYKNRNYNGYTPAIQADQTVRMYAENEFNTELSFMKNIKLIIPLGAAVEKNIDMLLADQKIPVLHGFPHPSGLNAHRLTLFRANQENMLRIIERAF